MMSENITAFVVQLLITKYSYLYSPAHVPMIFSKVSPFISDLLIYPSFAKPISWRPPITVKTHQYCFFYFGFDFGFIFRVLINTAFFFVPVSISVSFLGPHQYCYFFPVLIPFSSFWLNSV